ncbi:RloB family protein [Micrococcus luteus]|uniref:RloB family protein n=1 Tax=Micrococcus luteus TaxID=1270 RepID=UPI0021042E4F|nr:RloB family protein [Micrococcus luteus]UTX35261.1 RloB family protein [Micrococcus luteus]
MARRVLVATEGTLTERLYVEGLNSHLRAAGVTVTVQPLPVGRDPLRVVQKCIEAREKAKKSNKDFDVCVCLVDVDQHTSLASACSLAEKEGVLLLISNLKFEVWLRWHAEDRSGALSSSQLDRVAEELNLVKEKRLSTTFPFDGVDSACTIARRIDPEMKSARIGPNPSSALPLLVDIMR